MRNRIAQALAMTIAASVSNVVAAASGQAPGADGVTLEEIVVTARKREERLQDVPMSITVLSGDVLDRATFDGLREALNSVPGVAVIMRYARPD